MSQLRKIITVILSAFMLIAAGGVLVQGNRFQGTELTIVPVAGNVYMVQRPGGGGNIGVLSALKAFFSSTPCSHPCRTNWLRQ